MSNTSCDCLYRCLIYPSRGMSGSDSHIVVPFTNWTPLCVCLFVCVLPNRFLGDVPELNTAVIRDCCITATGRTTIKCQRDYNLPHRDQIHRIRPQVTNTQFSLLVSALEPINHLIFSSVCGISPNSIVLKCLTSVIYFYIVICHAAYRCCSSLCPFLANKHVLLQNNDFTIFAVYKVRIISFRIWLNVRLVYFLRWC